MSSKKSKWTPKTNQYYVKALQSLRHSKIVKFNFKTRTKLSRGQKSAITKAMLMVDQYKMDKFIPIPKKKNEGEKRYRKRLSDIKTRFGQYNKNIKGLFLDVPDYVDLKIKKDFTIESHQFVTTDIYRKKALTTKIFIPLGTFEEKINFINDPEFRHRFIAEIVKRYRPDFIVDRYSIALMYGSTETYGVDVTMGNLKKGLKKLNSRITTKFNKYGKKEYNEKKQSYELTDPENDKNLLLNGFVITYAAKI